MGMSLKKKSKRQPVRQRHRVSQKVSEHNRKARKAAKTDVTWKSKVKKDIGIPASFPYKAKLVADIVERKRLDQEAKVARRQAGSQAGAAGDADEMDEDEGDVDLVDMDGDEEEGDGITGTGQISIADFAASIASRTAQYKSDKRAQKGAQSDDDDDDDDEDMLEDDLDEDDVDDDEDEEWDGFEEESSSALKKETSRKMFDKDFKNVVEMSDVVLFVLDARDPEQTRSREVERMVLRAAGGDKRLLLVLNKVDLVPTEIVRGWLAHLNQSFPTIAARATRAPASRDGDGMQATAAALLKAIKTYAAKSGLKRAVSVGVVGYPNVGKSSIINALLSAAKHSRIEPCPTGAEAGVTRTLKELKLDSKVKLIDSPGIVYAGANKGDVAAQAQLVLLNAIPSQQIVDPLPAVSAMLAAAAKSREIMAGLMELYDLPPLVTSKDGTTADPHDFLVHVARKRGRIRRGGIPDVESAARAVLGDWRDGRLRWYTTAPAVTATSAAPIASANNASSAVASESTSAAIDGQPDIVAAWSKEFDIDGLFASV